MKDIFTRIFNSAPAIPADATANSDAKEFELFVTDLYKEAKKEQDYFYSNPKLSNCATYEKLKNKQDEFKVNLILYLPKVIYQEQKQIRQKNNWSETQTQREINEVRISLLNALVRTKIAFPEAALVELMNYFREFNDGNRRFNEWPIGFTVIQITKYIKINGLSDSFRTYLDGVLKWPEFTDSKNYWGSDIQKAKIKLEEVVFNHSDSKMASPPYKLNESDKFGIFVNQKIAELDTKDAQYWFKYFYLALTATAGKPTKKYQTQSKELIATIGNGRFKSTIVDFITFVTQLKPAETIHTSNWRDQQYSYSTWVFLEEKNLIILKGMIWSLVQFHDSKTLSALADLAEHAFKKIPGIGPTAAGVGNAAIYVLANSRGLEGISHLSRLKLKITQNNTRNLIQKYLDEGSAKLGISPEEIEEISIPDFGLKDGKKAISFVDHQLVVELVGAGKTKMTWIKPDGTIQKTPPAFLKQNSKLKQLFAKTKDEIKKIQKYSSAQKNRIDRSFIFDRTWTYDSFEKYYLGHGLVSTIAKKLIWTIKNGADVRHAIYKDDIWVTLDNGVVEVDSFTKVSIWHPIFDTTDNVISWRNKLEELQWQQPLKQAYREIYILTDAEINTKTYSNRMAAHLLKQHQFKSLTGVRNWKYQLMGAYDDGRDNEIAQLSLPSWGLVAEYWINEVTMDGAYNDAGIWDYVATDQVKFVDTNGESKNLLDIPPIVLSEVLRDADLFVGVASVGNDPAWQDSGGERVRQYADYWTQYAFGDLNELAKTRKLVLEKLLPRLKIRNVASIDGKFLRIKGKIREYKIHIGSTNIMMEPNDQYLCIVPAAKAAADSSSVFLPFEGDRGLSLIISKAFLLAADDKITDPVILNQLK